MTLSLLQILSGLSIAAGIFPIMAYSMDRATCSYVRHIFAILMVGAVWYAMDPILHEKPTTSIPGLIIAIAMAVVLITNGKQFQGMVSCIKKKSKSNMEVS